MVSLYFISTSTSFLVTYIIYKLSNIYSPRYFPSYSKLSLPKTIDWDSRISSNIHAVIVSVLGLYALWFDYETAANPIWNDSPLIKTTVSFTLGYGLADLMIILLNYKHIGDRGMVIHHIVTIIAYYCVVFMGVLPYFAIFRMVAEFSTPFVNQRWFYDAIGHPRSSREFVSVGLLLTITFFLARILVMPVYYLRCWEVWFTPEREDLGIVVCFIWIFTCIVLDVLNIYWFYKMLRGIFKIFIKPLVTKKKEEEKKE